MSKYNVNQTNFWLEVKSYRVYFYPRIKANISFGCRGSIQGVVRNGRVLKPQKGGIVLKDGDVLYDLSWFFDNSHRTETCSGQDEILFTTGVYNNAELENISKIFLSYENTSIENYPYFEKFFKIYNTFVGALRNERRGE